MLSKIFTSPLHADPKPFFFPINSQFNIIELQKKPFEIFSPDSVTIHLTHNHSTCQKNRNRINVLLTFCNKC